ncbi:hypothetical protein [Natribacillus halophilus]|uniref:Uncharacterized protein n=1 Tax=Natribacillus halophilus TaxID=549003 RepID=A0A1G8LQP7_9BACI|nr:hypothetical protein [Natribacillus halophilus]SDI57935.1 hypothetical protein SAMN04488123_103219 [Natribacillus halophilus]
MQTRDRIIYILITGLALGTLVFGVEGTETMPFLVLAVSLFALSLIGYFLFYSLLNTGWFYNIWLLNGVTLGLAFYFEDVYIVLIPLTVIWLALLASDSFIRQQNF